jgi:uncharacterized protein with von Willebrand factor type A (vWA) domain
MLTALAPTLEARAAARLAGFPGFLRANGFAVGGADGVPVLRTAQRVGALDPEVLRWSLQALLCGRCDEWSRFDELFDAWFLPANAWQRPERREAEGAVPSGEQPHGSQQRDTTDERDEVRPRHAASRQEVLSSSDFRALTEREHALDIEALMRRFARQLRHIRLRRGRGCATAADSICRRRSGAAWRAAARSTSLGATAGACGRACAADRR